MAFDAHPNFAVSTIAVVPSAGATASAGVATGTGIRFAGGPFNAVICPAGMLATPANAEVVRVLARSGDVLSIQRAQEASTQRTVQVSDQIYVAATGKAFTDIETMFSNTAGWATTVAPFNLTAAFAKVPLDSRQNDPHLHFDLTNHRYVVPLPGTYSVKGNINAASTAANQWCECAIYKNGSEIVRGSATVSTASGQPLSSVAPGDIPCIVGDVIELWAIASATIAANILATTNSLSCVRVDN